MSPEVCIEPDGLVVAERHAQFGADAVLAKRANRECATVLPTVVTPSPRGPQGREDDQRRRCHRGRGEPKSGFERPSGHARLKREYLVGFPTFSEAA
jgi:hypothetical protein